MAVFPAANSQETVFFAPTAVIINHTVRFTAVILGFKLVFKFFIDSFNFLLSLLRGSQIFLGKAGCALPYLFAKAVNLILKHIQHRLRTVHCYLSRCYSIFQLGDIFENIVFVFNIFIRVILVGLAAVRRTFLVFFRSLFADIGKFFFQCRNLADFLRKGRIFIFFQIFTGAGQDRIQILLQFFRLRISTGKTFPQGRDTVVFQIVNLIFNRSYPLQRTLTLLYGFIFAVDCLLTVFVSS